MLSINSAPLMAKNKILGTVALFNLPVKINYQRYTELDILQLYGQM